MLSLARVTRIRHRQFDTSRGKLEVDQIASALQKADAKVLFATLSDVAFLKEPTADRMEALILRAIKLAEPLEPSFG